MDWYVVYFVLRPGAVEVSESSVKHRHPKHQSRTHCENMAHFKVPTDPSGE